MHLTTLTGEAILPLLDDLARLRIAVFRAWPYLYDGDAAYEARYLRRYAECPRAALIGAFDGDTLVGAATCLPLADEGADIQAPFLARSWNPARFFYFGESVLLPSYRGQGLGVGFFAAREAHAAGADYTCFCAVDRPADHPLRPADAKPLDGFWRNRGYTRYPELRCRMAWRDLGETAETEKQLVFWLRAHNGASLP